MTDRSRATLTTIALSAAAASLLLGGCSTSGASPTATAPTSAAAASPSPSAEPRTADAAKVVAQAEGDAYAAGDWGGAWDLWTKAGQAAFPRADYIRFHTTCKTLVGPPLIVKSVRPEGTDGAVVVYERLGFTFSYPLRYEDGRWRFQPHAEDMADYATGVDKMIAKRRAAGSCGGQSAGTSG